MGFPVNKLKENIKGLLYEAIDLEDGNYDLLTDAIVKVVHATAKLEGGIYPPQYDNKGNEVDWYEWLMKNNYRWNILSEQEVEKFEEELAWLWDEELTGEVTDRLLDSIGMKR